MHQDLNPDRQAQPENTDLSAFDLPARTGRLGSITGLAAGILGLSMLFGEAEGSKALENSPHPTSPVATRSAPPPNLAADRPASGMRPIAQEDDPNFISSFVVGSRAGALSEELTRQIEAGKQVDKNKVITLFWTIENDSGAAVGLSYCKRFLDATKSEPQATRAILGFISRRATLKPDLDYIKPYLASEDTSVVATALEVAAASPRVEMPLKDMNRYYASKETDVRGAALDLKIAKAPDSVASFSTLELVEGARILRFRALNRGSEVRLAQHLVKKIAAEGDLKSADLRPVQMPLLHLLQDIDRGFPGYLQGLAKKDGEKLDVLCRELAREIIRMREALGEKVLARKGTRMISALHEEPGFVASEMERFAKRFDLKLSEPFKGTRNFAEHNPKDDYLEALRELSVSTKPALVWNAMHGGPNHHWFTSGQAGREVTDVLKDPRAVSYREFAQALIEPQLEKAKADKKPAQIKLDHITVILDACLQYNFVRNMDSEILAIAKKNDAQVVSLPTMVVISQRSMYGWVNRGTDNRSLLQVALDEIEIADGEPFRMKHLYAADRILNKAFLEKLKTHDAPYTAVNAEDMAIFETHYMKLEDLFKKLAPALKKAEIEAPKGSAGDPTVIEVSSSGKYLLRDERA